MKRRILILALAFAAVTAAIGTTVASLLPAPPVAVYVYDTTDTSGTLVLLGSSINIPTAPGTSVITLTGITKRSTGQQIGNRTARNSAGVAYPAASAVSVNASAYSIP